jgi:D-psicose/D-tagatose/L-ribulose 3-epimerase
MEIALCNEVLGPLPFAAQCDLAARLGYDALELAPYTLSAEPHRLTGSEIKIAGKALRDAGLKLAGLHWLLVSPPGLSITAADPETRNGTVIVLERLVALCAELGGRVLVHGSPAQRQIPPEDDRQNAEKRALDILSRAAEHAAAAGVLYCLEPLPPASTNYVNSLADAADVIRKIGKPSLRTMIDASAAAATESDPLPEVVKRWLPTGLVAHVHLNDRNRRAPGQGSDTFAPIIDALREAGYDRFLSIEPFVYEPDGPACAARAIGYIRGIIEALGP